MLSGIIPTLILLAIENGRVNYCTTIMPHQALVKPFDFSGSRNPTSVTSPRFHQIASAHSSIETFQHPDCPMNSNRTPTTLASFSPRSSLPSNVDTVQGPVFPCATKSNSALCHFSSYHVTAVTSPFNHCHCCCHNTKTRRKENNAFNSPFWFVCFQFRIQPIRTGSHLPTEGSWRHSA